MDVVTLPLTKLVRAEWNANRVDEQTLEKIRRSLQEFGVVENLVVRPLKGRRGFYEVLSGNHRRDLYEQEGMSEAPCVVVKLDDARARVLAQTLNRTRGQDDPLAYRELLQNVLAELPRETVLDFLPETPASLERILGPPGDAPIDISAFQAWGVIVEAEDEQQQLQLLERFAEEGLHCRALMS